MTLLAWLALWAGTAALPLRADTCSYTYQCSSQQCADVMGGMSGTRSQSGVTLAQCESARSQIANMSSRCTCTPDGGAADGSAASGSDVKMAVGHNLQQNMVSMGANMMVSNIQNPYVNKFMSSFTNTFLQTMFDNQAEAQRQRQIIDQQLAEQQREREEQQRIAEQQRIDAMFARLNRELKLEHMPFNLTLKAMNTPTDLELKSMSSDGPDDLKLKISAANSTSYGLKGLPGMYVGGPAGSDETDQQSAPGDSASGGAVRSANPNLVSGPGTGTTGPGIPGLSGIYLDGVSPNQAPQLAQAAEKLSGPERDLAQDTALQAAQKNPALTTPSQDPQVQKFQQTVQEYDQAASEAKKAQQQLSNGQASVDADHTVIEIARGKMDSASATQAQQQAFSQMVQAAKTDEDAAAAGQQIFDNANATLVLTRTKAATALAALSGPPSASNDASVVDLSQATHMQPSILRASSTPIATPAPIRVPAVTSTSARAAAPTRATPRATPPQLCTQLTQAQDALRRLMRTQETQSENREQWENEIDADSDDALQRGLDMLRDYGGEKLSARLEEMIRGQDKEIAALYVEISDKKGSEVGDLQKKFEQLDLNKARLQDALKRAEVDKKHLDELANERDFLDWT
ncbi:MAG: hypothetical protein ACRD2S_09620, partial [Terriglobales bacterium]